MYELKNGDAFLRLSEDLDILEYGRGELRYQTASPFQFVWNVPITTRDILNKNITVTDSRIMIDLSEFVFHARFPGNTYCRPDPSYTPNLHMTITLELDGDDLVINASSIDHIGEDCHLEVLLAQGLMKASTQKKAALYIPVNHGIRFDFPRNDIFQQIYRPGVAWALPVHGLFTEEGGIGLWCEDFDRDYAVAYNTDRAGTVSVCCRELYDAISNEARQMRFMLFEKGESYIHLMKRCRALRKATGRFMTLQEKAAQRPVVAELPGTVFWKHNVYFKDRPEGVEKTYSLYVRRPDWNENEGLPGNWTAEEVFGTAKENGFDRVAVCNTGWNRDGFDAGYPTRLPVNPERGNNDDFKNAAKKAQELSKGYFLNVHDNYIDAYKGEAFDEEEMLQIFKGAPAKGGVWKGGQAYRLCSYHGLKYAQRDLPKLAEISGPGCIYIDVFAGTPLECCKSDKHPTTRKQNWEYYRELCKVAHKYIGALAVEGCGTDHYADLVDIGAYGGLHFNNYPLRADGPVPVPVPMWQLVYHDSVLNYIGEGYLPFHGSEYRIYQALYTLLPTAFDAHSKRLSFELREAYTAEMLDFEEIIPRKVTIDADGGFRTHGVVRSVYADGTEVIANFNEDPYDFNGHMIPARDFIINKR